MAAFHSCTSGNQKTTDDEQLLCTFVMMTLMGFCWYVLYEAMVVAAAEQLKRLLVVSPLLLMVVVHWLSLLPDSHLAHRATAGVTSSAWGIAIVLFLLILAFLH